MKKPIHGAWICLALALSPVGGCLWGDNTYFGTTVPQHGPDVIWINNSTEPEWIDPSKCSDSPGGEVIWNTFAGLTQAHPATLEPMPDVAKSWDISKDGRIYTFHLRPSAWSDGRPLTAHDFEWSWKRLLDPETASKYASIAYPLLNGSAFNQSAIFVQGLPETTQQDELKALFSKTVPVDSVSVSRDPKGFLVYVGGEEDQKSAHREKLIAGFNGKAWRGSTLKLKIADGSIVGVTALDDLTLVVKLTDPIPYFLHLANFYTFSPVPRHVIERLEREGKNTDLWTRVENFVSNGAYVLADWKFRQYMVFEKNPQYWDAANTKTSRIKVLMVESYNTSLNYYYGGYLDWIGNNTFIPSEYLDHVSKFEDFSNGPYLSEYFYWINTKEPPMTDVRVRKAFSLAVDREALVKYVTRAKQIPSANVVPDGLAGYQSPKNPTFDPGRAKELLAQAGYPNGKNFPRLTLIYNTAETHKQIAEAIQQMWKANLGVNVEIENQEWKVYLKNLEQHNFQLARLGWVGDFPDPYTFLELFSEFSGNNHSNWHSKKYDRMLLEANGELDPKKRMKLLRQAEELLLDAQPVIPLYVYTKPSIKKPFVRGWWANIQDRHPWKYLWIDRRWYEGKPESVEEDVPPQLAALN